MNPTRAFLPLALLCLASASRAASLAVWNFNDGFFGQAALLGVDRMDAAIASAAMTTTFPSTSVTGGTFVGRDGADMAGQALALPSGSSSGAVVLYNGNTLTFSVTKAPGASLSGVGVSFAARNGGPSGFAFASHQLAYSADGATFTDVDGPFGLTAGYLVRTFDLFGVSALNSASTLTFRITFDGATRASALGTAIDNIVVSGDVQAVPEPSTLVAFGLGALGALRRRKSA